MAKKVKDNERYSLYDNVLKPELFLAHDGSIVDSSDWRVIHKGIDTVRQLYAGLIDPFVYSEIERVYNDGFGLCVNVGGFDWIVSTGGRSGYRYTLKNQNIGLVILIGSTFIEPKYNGHHLKIQASPVFLMSRSVDDIQTDLDHFASFFIDQLKHTGVAVHICVDVQGWIPPNDLDCRLTTKARRVFKYSTVESMDFDVSDFSVVYGKGNSFTFGSASTLQFGLYNKLKAVKEKGELPLWLPVWSQCEDFDEQEDIFRFEFRFHQSVIEQFANGSGFEPFSLSDLEPHLNGLWQYGLNNFRLDDTKTYINPFWQWLRDDVKIVHSQMLDIDYKRLYQSPSDDGVPSDRSISICFGQLCSIYGRNGYDLKRASQHLQNSGIWQNLADMFNRRGKDSDDIFIVLSEKLARFEKKAA